MGNGIKSDGANIEDRLHQLEADIARQRVIVDGIRREGHSAIGSNTLLGLLEEERQMLLDWMRKHQLR